jgi:hypothetical protein
MLPTGSYLRRPLTVPASVGILSVSARVGPMQQVHAKPRQVRKEAAVSLFTWVISISRLGGSLVNVDGPREEQKAILCYVLLGVLSERLKQHTAAYYRGIPQVLVVQD